MKKLFAGLLMVSALLLTGFITGCGSSGGSASDAASPKVLIAFPLDKAVNVAKNVKVTASFDMKMKAASITAESFSLSGPDGKAVAGNATLAPDGLSAVYIPTANFKASTVYTAKLTTDVQSAAGGELEKAYKWSFTTGELPDTTAPTVLSMVPANGATVVGLNANITAIFSEVMDPLTVTVATITLKKGSVAVGGVVTAPLTTTVSFNPTADLEPNTTYTATITTGVKDLAGNAMATAKSWTFTTRALSALGPQPVDLKTAGNYVIMAKTGVTNVPTSAVTGDIGISPIIVANGAITFFDIVLDGTGTFATSPQVTGKVYVANFAAPTPLTLIQAVLDMEGAYNDAEGRTVDAILNAHTGQLGGQTLVPGLYKFTTGVTITDDLTLAGSENDVWIFQIAQTLNISAGKKILLSGNSLSKNVFWQVAEGVTMGAGAQFKGIVLGKTAITLVTGASVDGRLYAQTAVPLQQATVTQPAP